VLRAAVAHLPSGRSAVPANVMRDGVGWNDRREDTEPAGAVSELEHVELEVIPVTRKRGGAAQAGSPSLDVVLDALL